MQDSTSRSDPPVPNEAVHYGLAGEIVRFIEPHTEADPLAILTQILTAFGNAVGRNPHFMAEADKHGANLFAVHVGETAKARKGVSWGHARRPVIAADPSWKARIYSGLSSGEGLIWQVRDPMEMFLNGKTVNDPGVSDKRLLVFEGEFASVLRVLSRDGNTLSAVIRNAWDGADLSILTKNNPARATSAHISVIGHVTRNELLRYLSATEAANGFGNRFCWFWVQRSKLLPEGGRSSDQLLAPFIERLGTALEFARNIGELKRDERARALWHDIYPTLSDGKPDLLGAITARAEPMVMRFALLYALLDCSPLIREPHLRAALALWEYAEASAHYIFRDQIGLRGAGKILEALRANPAGLTRTEISKIFGNNRTKEEIDGMLAVFADLGQARCNKSDTGGRPVERWFAT